MSQTSNRNWSFFFKVLSYVATAVAGFFTGEFDLTTLF